MVDTQVGELIEKLQQLSEERQMLMLGKLAPPDCWLQTYEVNRRYLSGVLHTYWYLKWECVEPIFIRNPKKFGHRGSGKHTRHQHIGRLGSTSGLGEVAQCRAARVALANRRRLEAINEAIAKAEAAVKVMFSEEPPT